jgi:hypothetical protein
MTGGAGETEGEGSASSETEDLSSNIWALCLELFLLECRDVSERSGVGYGVFEEALGFRCGRERLSNVVPELLEGEFR